MGKESQFERKREGEAGNATREERGEDAREEEWLRCAACGHALARERARIEVEGRHVHTFVNPAGHEYTIRCFAEAPGCAGAGEESTFWSWFPRHAWRIALCGACGTHAGWSFRRDASVFWGLIATTPPTARRPPGPAA